MVYYYILEIFFGAMEAFASLLITIVLFRLPFRSNKLLITIMSFFISSISLLFYNFLEIGYFLGESILILALFLFYRLFMVANVRQAMLVTLVGYIAGPVLLISVVFGALDFLGVLDGELSNSKNSLLELITIQYVYALITTQISIFLNHYRIGFSLTYTKDITIGKGNLLYDKAFSIIILTVVISLYFGNALFINPNSFTEIRYVVIFILVTVSFIFIYLRNLKQLKSEYEKMKDHLRM